MSQEMKIDAKLKWSWEISIILNENLHDLDLAYNAITMLL